MTRVDTSELKAVLKDLSGRRSMNAVGSLQNQDVKRAAFESGAGHGLGQALAVVEQYEEAGKWPDECPDDAFVSFVEAMRRADPPESNGPPEVGVQ